MSSFARRTSISKPSYGHGYKWVKSPSEELLCKLCLRVATDPYQHRYGSRGCGKVFCKRCLVYHLDQVFKCPCCKKPPRMYEDRQCAERISSLDVQCENQDNGCEWVGQLGSHNKHVKSCDYALILCPRSCLSHDGNKVTKLPRSELAEHLKQCPKRETKCRHCKVVGDHDTMADHSSKCPRVRVACPNHPCPAKTFRCNLSLHQARCRYEQVKCKYRKIGCWKTLPREDIEDHEDENDGFHLEIACDQLVSLTKMLDFTIMSPFTFKVRHFEQQRTKNKLFCSHPFYTSSSGYKMFVKVYLNGRGQAKGSHVSAYVCIMKGENDSTLSWPFAGSMTIEILNQHVDKYHYQEVVVPGNDMQRVVQGEYGTGYGSPEFIAHDQLRFTRIINCLYLKDDTLIFRVSVHPRGYKPWLDCSMNAEQVSDSDSD